MFGPLVPRTLLSSGRRPVVALTLVLLWAGVQAPLHSASLPAARGAHGMVVTPDARASEVGLDVLRAGGNAVDAAIAVHFALAVTYPQAGNVGGGGFMLYRSPGGEYFALDFRETAPRKLRAESFLDEDGKPVPGLSLWDGLAVGVPGSVAGMARAHADWGTRPWSSLLAPSIRLAGKGFSVPRFLARSFVESGEHLFEDAEAARIFARNGEPLSEGDHLVQKDLAATLRRIAKKGVEGFYEGPVATAIEQTVAECGGVLDRRDLAAYEVIAREPVRGSYRGHPIVSFPPPSSGGVVLLQILGMLEEFDLGESGPGSSRTVHIMAEAERRAYADRSRWMGDPAFFEVPVDGLLDREYLSSRAATITLDRATPSAEVAPGKPGRPEPENTLHYSVADSRGGVVALTTTLNRTFGSGIVARGTGVLLNNEIDDFALAPGVPNSYGLLGGEANAVVAGKRPLSSMTPTIVESATGSSHPVLILGSPGGGRIITAVLQVVVNVVDHGMPLQEAVDAPRFHHQWQPDEIRFEARCLPADVRDNLESLGHTLAGFDGTIGNVNAIGVDDEGRWLGAADPRRDGAARGY